MTIHNKDEEEGTGTAGGGVGGKIHYKFQDAASIPPRDDALPPSEIRRLLIVHRDVHKERVDKQKLTRKEREALKEGKLHLVAGYRQALGIREGGIGKFVPHPILKDKAQFGVIDRQNNNNPTEFDAETNLEMRDKLENRFVHRNAPKFHPKPRPRGA